MKNVARKKCVSMLMVSAAFAIVLVWSLSGTAKADGGKKETKNAGAARSVKMLMQSAPAEHLVQGRPVGGGVMGMPGGGVGGPGMGMGGGMMPGGMMMGGPMPGASVKNNLEQLPLNDVLSIAIAVKPSDKDAPQLESLIQRTLALNPQVVAARAELQRAQAALERIQLEVTRNVIELRARWEVARRNVKRLEAKVNEDKENAELARAYVKARAELAQIERELPLLADSGMAYTLCTANKGDVCFGRSYVSAGTITLSGSGNLAAKKSMEESKMPKEFDKPITLQFDSTDMKDVSQFLQDISKVQFVVDRESAIAQGGIIVTINLKDIPLKDALQAIEDTTWPVKFVVRSYGVLVTDVDTAMTRFGVKPEGISRKSGAYAVPVGR